MRLRHLEVGVPTQNLSPAEGRRYVVMVLLRDAECRALRKERRIVLHSSPGGACVSVALVNMMRLRASYHPKQDGAQSERNLSTQLDMQTFYDT